ncbi:unnamed protein product [Allacma fusca]|uniref:G-protein coupled receptors family 2 profile 2 domain-containing protein n=1 Tax=Allacma fusca TaxID=39272 RepID=A0A8J2KFL4_9HEXA|nr:unnamed protein product [Allacma fusca]
MWVLITKLRSATNPETQQSRKAAKALVVLMPLLGITYVLVLRGSSQTPAYEIIRALLISTQGFLVALLYCFLNGEVRKALRHRWNRLRSMGQGFGCCEERSHMQQMRDWSPRSRTESIRLYTPTQTTPNNRKRESIASETVMTTVIGMGAVNGNNPAQPLLVTATPRRLSTATITKTYNATDNNLL